MLAVMALVVLSPLALSGLDGNIIRADWYRLSNIGSTYGAVSAIIAAIALVGVATSLIIQSREAKATRTSALRNLHVDLLRMAMEDPAYMECWGTYLTDSFEGERQYAYVNLIINHWYSMYELDECTDAILLAMAAELFSSAPGRHFWHYAGPSLKERAPNRRASRFYRLVDEAYRKTLEQPPAIPPPHSATKEPALPQAPLPSTGGRGLTLLLAVGCGAVVSIALHIIYRVLRRIRMKS
ncbi:MAG: hypothetical protein JO309_06580 [Pseudonocardiales bacterium]|nr:hypothetical protein [Pseudonocardiales bacterium]